MTLRTAAGFLAVVSLISTEIFALNLEVNQRLALSIPFGNISVVGVPPVPTLSQVMAVKMWGKLSSLFYVDGEIKGTDFDRFTLDYLPANVSFGTVTCPLFDGSSLSIFGLSSKSLAIGQMLGTVKIEDFVAKSENERYTLGPVLPGSVSVYVNGLEIPRERYNLDCETGSLEISDLDPGDVVSVSYQSPGKTQGYVMNLRKKFYSHEGEFLIDLLGTFSRNSEYYLSSEFKNRFFKILTRFDLGEAMCAYSKFTTWTNFGNFKSSFSISARSAGFHEPFKVPQSADISLSLEGASKNATLLLKGDSTGMGAFLKTRYASFSAEVGKEENLKLNFSSGSLSLGTALGKSLSTFYVEASTSSGTLRLSMNPSGEFNLSLRTRTPLVLDFDSSGTESSLDLHFGNFKMNFENGENTKFGVETVGSLFPFATYKAGLEFENATPSVYFSSESHTPLGEFSLTLEASPNSMAWGGSLSYRNVTANLEYTHGTFKTELKADRNLFDNWHVGASILFGISRTTGFGGSVSLEIWRKDF